MTRVMLRIALDHDGERYGGLELSGELRVEEELEGRTRIFGLPLFLFLKLDLYPLLVVHT